MRSGRRQEYRGYRNADNGAGQPFNIWMLALALSFILNFCLGLGLVWVNTQRTTLGYELKRVRQVIAERSAYSSKLEVERDLLLSPFTLEQKAKSLGMSKASAGQIRQLR